MGPVWSNWVWAAPEWALKSFPDSYGQQSILTPGRIEKACLSQLVIPVHTWVQPNALGISDCREHSEHLALPMISQTAAFQSISIRGN